MPDINWGGDAAGAPFTSRLDDESGNLILAETDTGTGLFEWDGSAWQFRGPVEMNGEDVSGIGSLTATSGDFDSVNTDQLSYPLEDSDDISEQRDLGTAYQNNEDFVISVNSIISTDDGSWTSGDRIILSASVSDTESELDNVHNFVRRDRIDNPTFDRRDFLFSFFVPPGKFYQIADTDDVLGITTWVERGFTQ